MPETDKTNHLLVADDEKEIRKSLKLYLEHRGYKISVAPDGAAAIDIIKQGDVELIIADIKMPKLNGIELLSQIMEFNSELPVIMMTGYTDIERTVEALKAGASDFITKPFEMALMNDTIARLLDIRASVKENRKVLPHLSSNARIDIPSKLEYINGAIHYLDEQVKAMELHGGPYISNINTALYEAIVNAIEHGNRNDPGKKVTISTELDCRQAKFVIHDEGDGFDIEAVLNPTDPGNLYKIDGRGIYLMKHLMDEISYNDKGNEVTMVKMRTIHPSNNENTN